MSQKCPQCGAEYPLGGACRDRIDSIVWSRTIADVRLDDAGTYCSDIKLWAISVLQDTETLIQKLNIEP